MLSLVNNESVILFLTWQLVVRDTLFRFPRVLMLEIRGKQYGILQRTIH